MTAKSNLTLLSWVGSSPKIGFSSLFNRVLEHIAPQVMVQATCKPSGTGFLYQTCSSEYRCGGYCPSTTHFLTECQQLITHYCISGSSPTSCTAEGSCYESCPSSTDGGSCSCRTSGVGVTC